jgi:acetoin utilization deacetylase AcuC-like enzyme
MGVVVVSTAAADEHDMPPWHPERPARLHAVQRAVDVARGDVHVVDVDARSASREELLRVHDGAYLDDLRDLCGIGGGELDPDTPVERRSWDTACLAAGAGLAAADALRAGAGDAAFVAARPPGHHAMRDRGSGFCLLNNVAVTAAALVAAGERVVVVDWDVHHGNGTQAIFWDTPEVLYASLHQSPAYPGTGGAAETGGDGAPGGIVNVPLPPGATGDVALTAIERVVQPVVERFAPTWLLISAGYDAHRDDPLADLAWTAGDFALLAREVGGLAPGPGRTIAFLEGGYDLDALHRSVLATLRTLGGADVPPPEPPGGGGVGLEHVLLAERLRQRSLSEAT